MAAVGGSRHSATGCGSVLAPEPGRIANRTAISPGAIGSLTTSTSAPVATLCQRMSGAADGHALLWVRLQGHDRLDRGRDSVHRVSPPRAWLRWRREGRNGGTRRSLHPLRSALRVRDRAAAEPPVRMVTAAADAWQLSHPRNPRRSRRARFRCRGPACGHRGGARAPERHAGDRRAVLEIIVVFTGRTDASELRMPSRRLRAWRCSCRPRVAAGRWSRAYGSRP